MKEKYGNYAVISRSDDREEVENAPELALIHGFGDSHLASASTPSALFLT